MAQDIDINKVLIRGTVSDEPILRPAGQSQVLNLRVETTSRFNGRDGVAERRTWHSVTMWGKRAEKLAYLKAGDRVEVEGELKTSSYEKDGIKRYKTEVNASVVEPLGAGQDDDPASPAADIDDLPF